MGTGVVAKFGGSSVSDSQAMLSCAQIVKERPEIKIVILSATYNTTNLLEKLALEAKLGREAKEVSREIKAKHLVIADKLSMSDQRHKYLYNLFAEMDSLVDKIEKEKKCTSKTMDQLYSIGERMSSSLFVSALKTIELPTKEIVFFDVRDVLKTNSNFTKASPDLFSIKKESRKYLHPLLEDDSVLVVTQGFIGSNSKGETTTLGREGSDFSATLLAEAIDAQEVHIWTDVPGVATADPKVVKDAYIISELTYLEAEVLAHCGAKILFPKTLGPSIRKEIPVFVGSSLFPQQAGTWIKKNIKKLPSVRAIALKHFDADSVIISLVGNKLDNSIPLLYGLRKVVEEAAIYLTVKEVSYHCAQLIVSSQNAVRALNIIHTWLKKKSYFN